MIRIVLSTLVALGWALAAADAEPASGQSSKTYAFATHASFFSLESKQANLVDPQAFVADSAVAAGTGPQGIAHVAGVRPAFRIDDPRAAVINAQGRSLAFTLAQWFGARGSVTLTPSGSTTGAAFTFAGLVPDGRYSLFENHFSESGVTFTPLDGTATANSFTAAHDGTAAFQLSIPGAVTHAEGLLLVYHSDGHDHGAQRGELGVNAHHQLIVRVP